MYRISILYFNIVISSLKNVFFIKVNWIKIILFVCKKLLELNIIILYICV